MQQLQLAAAGQRDGAAHVAQLDPSAPTGAHGVLPTLSAPCESITRAIRS